MANISINDLLDSSELDKKAMAALLGGCGGTIAPWAKAYGDPFNMRSLRRPARGGSPFGGGTFPGGSGEGIPDGISSLTSVSFAQKLSFTVTLETLFSAQAVNFKS